MPWPLLLQRSPLDPRHHWAGYSLGDQSVCRKGRTKISLDDVLWTRGVRGGGGGVTSIEDYTLNNDCFHISYPRQRLRYQKRDHIVERMLP